MTVMPLPSGLYNLSIAPGVKLGKEEKEFMDIALENMGFTVTRGVTNIKVQGATLKQKEFFEGVFLGAGQTVKK